MGCFDKCISGTRLFLLRLINLGMLIVGLGLVIFGIIMLATGETQLNLVNTSLLAVGLFSSVFAGAMAFQCYNSRPFILFYVMVFTLLFLAEAGLGIAYNVPSLRDHLFKYATEEQQSVLKKNTRIAGGIFLGAAAAMLVSIWFAVLQYKHLGRMWATAGSLLDGEDDVEIARGSRTSATPKTDAARARLQDKYSHLYENH